jgi:hypothetical protein
MRGVNTAQAKHCAWGERYVDVHNWGMQKGIVHFVLIPRAMASFIRERIFGWDQYIDINSQWLKQVLLSK